MPSAFEIDVDKALDASKTLTAALVALAANVKTHAGNYDNACNMFYASEDQIKELKEKVKKDPKAAPELKKWQDNHPKIGARVKTEHAEVEKLRGRGTGKKVRGHRSDHLCQAQSGRRPGCGHRRQGRADRSQDARYATDSRGKGNQAAGHRSHPMHALSQNCLMPRRCPGESPAAHLIISPRAAPSAIWRCGNGSFG